MVYVGNYVRESLQAFRYKVTGYGLPVFKNFRLTVPVIISFTNPTSFNITADRVTIHFFIVNGSQVIPAGVVSQPVTIPAGSSKQTVNATVDIQNVYNYVADQWQNILGSKSIKLRTEVAITYKGIMMPTRTFEDVITV